MIVEVAEFESFAPDLAGDARIEDTLALAAERIEHYCNVKFTPQVYTETLTGVSGFAVTSWPKVISIDEIDGEASTLGPFDDGRFPLADGEHSVTYTHGYETSPLTIKRAVCLLTRHYLIEDPTDIDFRATSKTTELAAWSLVTPGMRGAIFPVPEVNEIVAAYRYVSLV